MSSQLGSSRVPTHTLSRDATQGLVQPPIGTFGVSPASQVQGWAMKGIHNPIAKHLEISHQAPESIMHPLDQRLSQTIREFSYEKQPQTEADTDSCLRTALAEDQKWREEQEKHANEAEDYLKANLKEELVELEAKRAELHALAREFHSYLPAELQEDVTTAPKSFRDVHKAAEKVRLSWGKRPETDGFAKAREYLRKVGSAIGNHSNTLKVIPSSNDYASVFCGALTVFIKASSNYERLSEGFARAMTDINDCITTVHEQVVHYKDEIWLQHLVLRLYCLIFSFLVNAMKWYTDKKRKRLMRSLNENIYSEYQEQLQQIRNLSEVIHKRVHSRSNTDFRSSLATIASMLHESPLKFQLELQEKTMEEGFFERLTIKRRNEHKKDLQEQREFFQQNIMKEWVSEASKLFAGAAATRLLQIMGSESRARSTSPAAVCDEQQQPLPASHGLPAARLTYYTRQDILLHSAPLADSYDDRRILPFFTTPANTLPTFLADADVVSGIHSLTVSPTSSILHVCGPWELSQEPQTALVAARYAEASRAAGASVVSYFCELDREEPPAGRTRETVALVALVYALIRQLVELLPEEEEGGDEDERKGPEGEEGEGEERDVSSSRFSDARFGPARFAALDGTLRTWDAALALLRDLLGAGDEPLLYVVVDGFNLLDDASYDSTTEALGRFVGLLRGVVETRAEEHLVKVLFTTAGPSMALNEVLDGGDVVRVTRPVGQGGAVRVGRRPL